VILNGPPGVGKTTVAAILRKFVASTVVISGDELRAFAPEDVRAHLGGGATYRAAGALAATFLRLGAERVIFEYVFLRRAHFDNWGESLRECVAPRVITLWAPLDVVIAREKTRRGPPRLGHAVSDCYREMSANSAAMGKIIETATLSAEAVAARVHELSSKGARA